MNQVLKTQGVTPSNERSVPDSRRSRRSTQVINRRRAWRVPRSALFFGVLALLLFLVNVWTNALPRQVTHPQDTRPGRGGVEIAAAAPFCGTPITVFEHFGIADTAGKLVNNTTLPTAATLSQLPATSDATHPISYNATTNQLCASDYASLYTHFVQTQAATQGTTNTTTTTNGNGGFQLPTLQLPSLNPADWAKQAVSGLWDSFWKGTVNFVQTQVVDWASSFGVMYITPAADSYKHPVVTNGVNWSLGIMNGLLACILVVGGYNALLGYRAGQPVGENMQFILKFILTAVAANIGFMAFLPQIIELNNSMCMGITTALGHAANGNFTLPLGALNWVEQPVTWAVFIVIDFVFALLLIIVMMVRLALLDFLIIIGPLAIMCYAIPQLESIARFWATSFFSALFVQFFMTGTLALGSAFIAGFGHASATPVTIFLGIATLYLAFKWPSMLFSQALRQSAGVVHRDIIQVARTITSEAALAAA